MKLLVIHGPNINLLGKREPETYGALTMEEINSRLDKIAKEHDIQLEFFQSNIEGELVDRIQTSLDDDQAFDGIIINPAAYTHTSVAIRDVLAAVTVPVVEVHISNIYKREEFRHKSLTAAVVKGQISGFGAQSYELALMSFIKSN